MQAQPLHWSSPALQEKMVTISSMWKDGVKAGWKCPKLILDMHKNERLISAMQRFSCPTVAEDMQVLSTTVSIVLQLLFAQSLFGSVTWSHVPNCCALLHPYSNGTHLPWPSWCENTEPLSAARPADTLNLLLWHSTLNIEALNKFSRISSSYIPVIWHTATNSSKLSVQTHPSCSLSTGCQSSSYTSLPDIPFFKVLLSTEWALALD